METIGEDAEWRINWVNEWPRLHGTTNDAEEGTEIYFQVTDDGSSKPGCWK